MANWLITCESSLNETSPLFSFFSVSSKDDLLRCSCQKCSPCASTNTENRSKRERSKGPCRTLEDISLIIFIIYPNYNSMYCTSCLDCKENKVVHVTFCFYNLTLPPSCHHPMQTNLHFREQRCIICI